MHHGRDVKNIVVHAVNDGVGKTVEIELAIMTAYSAPAFRFGHDAAQGTLELVNEVIAQARLPLYQSAAPSSSWSTSGWLTTCIQLCANVSDGVFYGAALNLAFLDFTGAPVNHLVPLRFGINVHGIVEAGDEGLCKIRPVLFRQGQDLSDFFGGYAHANIISSLSRD